MRARAAAAAVLLWAAGAGADLGDDARRVEALWGKAGLRVERAAPRFLEQGRMKRVPLTAEQLQRGRCVSVAVVASRGIDFALRPMGLGALGLVGAGSALERPAAGLGWASRCDEERETLSLLALEMKSARGAFEILVATGDEPAPEPQQVLPERQVVPAKPPLDPGRPPGQTPLAVRVRLAEARARGDGAPEVNREALQASDEGHGRATRVFAEGCHRVELLADNGPSGRVADVDAELRDPKSGALLIRDRSDTPDARLEFCTGEEVPLRLLFGGAPRLSEVVVVGARWPLPKRLPGHWGPRARGAMALALRRRHAPALTREAEALTTGASGSTALPLELTPGACYVAALGVARGEARGLSVSGVLEGQWLHDEGHAGGGAALAFCSRTTERLVLQVEARGAGLLWGAALWRVGP